MVLFFFAGAASCFMTMWYFAARDQKKSKSTERTTPRKWTALRNLNFSWDFDYGYTTARTTERIVADLAYFMQEQMRAKNAEELSKIVIEPGNYTLKMSVNCAFIRRD